MAWAQAPSAEYLPPLSDAAEASASSDSAKLADDGYRYKTVRKLRRYRHRREVSDESLTPTFEEAPSTGDLYRHRRDVSELPSVEYLPPVQDDEGTAVGKNGYKYKTVRKLRKYRTHRH